MSTEPGAGEAEPLACPSCARKYPLDERFCADCEMPLVYVGRGEEEPITEAHERARKVKPQYLGGELVKAALGRNQAEAELIQGMLLEEGIPSVQRRTRGFDVPDFLAAGPRDILVPEAGLRGRPRAARRHRRAADLEPGRRRRAPAAAAGRDPDRARDRGGARLGARAARLRRPATRPARCSAYSRRRQSGRVGSWSVAGPDRSCGRAPLRQANGSSAASSSRVPARGRSSRR